MKDAQRSDKFAKLYMAAVIDIEEIKHLHGKKIKRLYLKSYLHLHYQHVHIVH